MRSIPFLLFDGNCAEAMTFYHECWGGDLTISKLGDSPMKDMLPPDKWGRTINAHLQSGDVEISATDWMAAPQYLPKFGNTMAIFITGDDLGKLKAAFERLSQGAKQEKFQPLHELPIGMYGQFDDKFGIHWIFLNPKTQA